MATATITTAIKRARPLVTELFRNTILYRPETEKEMFFQATPRMVILFTWLGAKEKIARKYIKSWNDHGFSVMHVTTNVEDLLFPKTKSEVTVKQVVDFLMKSNHNIIIHGLSVGGYLGTRVVMESGNTDIMPRMTHQIFDSFTNTIGLQAGVEHAVPYPLNKVASFMGRVYYKYADLSVFRDTEKFLTESPATIPTYYMHSLGDYVARYENIDAFVQAQGKTSPTSILLLPEWKKIGHVNLFRRLGEKPYMSSIFKFLGRNNFNIRTEFAIKEETKELTPMEKQLKP